MQISSYPSLLFSSRVQTQTNLASSTFKAASIQDPNIITGSPSAEQLKGVYLKFRGNATPFQPTTPTEELNLLKSLEDLDKLFSGTVDSLLMQSPVLAKWLISASQYYFIEREVNGKPEKVSLPGSLATVFGEATALAWKALEKNPALLEKPTPEYRDVVDTIAALIPNYQVLNAQEIKMHLQELRDKFAEEHNAIYSTSENPQELIQKITASNRIINGFGEYLQKNKGSSPSDFIEYLKSGKEKSGNNTLHKVVAILDNKASALNLDKPLSLKQALNILEGWDSTSHVGAFLISYKPTFPMAEQEEDARKKLITAHDIAWNSRSNTIEPKHLILALLRQASDLAKKAPQFLQAPPDQIPHKFIYNPNNPNDTIPARFQRMALDTLIPLKYRKDLTEQQIASELMLAQTQVDSLVYGDEGQSLAPRPLSSRTPRLSDTILKAVQQTAVKPNEPGDYLYSLTDMIRKIISEAPDQESQQLSQITNGLVERAKNKSSSIPDTTYDDIAGYDYVKEQMKDAMQTVKDYQSGKIKNLKKVENGIILHGPPGTGKTIMAKAAANDLKAPFFHYQGSDFSDKYTGESERKVREMFEKASKYPIALVFIDEIDSLLPARTDHTDSGSVGNNSKVSTFLGLKDGIVQYPGIIFIGTTNRKDSLDPAAIRPGRFNKLIEVNLPELDDVEKILRFYLSRSEIPPTPDLDIKYLAQENEGSSPAELEKLVNEAEKYARKQGKAQLEIADFDEAMEIIDIGPRTPGSNDDFTQEVVVRHETAGHGSICYALDIKMRTLSTIPRGGTGGYVYRKSVPGLKSQTLEYHMNELLVMLGGRAIEELSYGPHRMTAGARSDYKNARKMLLHMIHDGQVIGHASRSGLHQEEPTEQEAEVVEALLTRALDVAKQMVLEIPELNRESMLQYLEKGVELHHKEITDFYANYIPPDVKERMKSRADSFIAEIVKDLNRNARTKSTKYLKGQSEGHLDNVFKNMFLSVKKRFTQSSE